MCLNFREIGNWETKSQRKHTDYIQLKGEFFFITVAFIANRSYNQWIDYVNRRWLLSETNACVKCIFCDRSKWKKKTVCLKKHWEFKQIPFFSINTIGTRSVYFCLLWAKCIKASLSFSHAHTHTLTGAYTKPMMRAQEATIRQFLEII